MSENLNLRKAQAAVAGIIQDRSFRKTVAHHEAIRREMLAGLCDERDFDEIDFAVEDLPGPARARSEKEVSRILGLLDELKGKDGEG